MTKIHDLKIWPEYYKPVLLGLKKFELRYNADRKFVVGDVLCLKEYNFEFGLYTGASLKTVIIYKLDSGFNGIEEGYCVLGISHVFDVKTAEDEPYR